MTDIGNKVRATCNHPLLALRNNLEQEWVRVDHLRKGDLLCIPTKPMTRKTKLELNLSQHVQFAVRDTKANWLTTPKYMTADLAFNFINDFYS